MRCVVSCGSTSFPWLVLFFGALLWGSMIHKHTESRCEKGVHQSYLETERNTLVIPNWFRPCQCCCCLCYPGEYLRLGTLSSYNLAQLLEACNSLKLLSIYFDLCWCHWCCMSSAWSSRHRSPFRRLWRLCRDTQQILPILLPLLLSHLSRNMLKRVGESRHPCRSPTVVQNQSPMLLLNRTALVALL